MVRGIERLGPGSFVTIALRDGLVHEERFWEFEFTGDRDDLDEATSATRAVLTDSVAHHVISDVPVGAFLSGGVDSAITATLMQRQRAAHGLEPVKTFTIGFDEVSELAEARQVATRIGSDHHEVRVSRDEYLEVLDSVAWHFDEPVADPSAVALYFLARAAREEVKVVLSGEGADELFGGYLIYREPKALAPVARAPRALRSGVLGPVSRLPFGFPGRGYLRRGLTPFAQRYIGNAYIFRPHEVRTLWRGALPDITHIRPADALRQRLAPGMPDARRMQLVDIAYWLPGDILAKADRMTMAHSLELRVPYLDVEVAGLAATIPDRWKYRDGTTKWLLRRAFADILPTETAGRRKLGFPTPLRYWLRQDPSWFKERIFGDEYIGSHMHPAPIERLFTDHLAGTADNSRKIYVLLMLALWRRAFPGIT
jgi:asparagine synthase (glutamine-hydrolysing)